AINAVLQADLQLMNSTVGEALQRIPYGKKDTLGLDGIPESAIINSLHEFDRDALLITEEIGSAGRIAARPSSRAYPPTFYLSDPTDRSDQLKEFLEDKDPAATIGEIMRDPELVATWEHKFGQPRSITGPMSAI